MQLISCLLCLDLTGMFSTLTCSGLSAAAARVHSVLTSFSLRAAPCSPGWPGTAGTPG